ncbi:MAG: hypothetical protein HY795_08735 [Desulfovibrio sp.]|nr:hypothetical protein [Desulfovibrio sp.]MBI4958905.1 hypothetical protein [Desulfovibrio sp.]
MPIDTGKLFSVVKALNPQGFSLGLMPKVTHGSFNEKVHLRWLGPNRFEFFQPTGAPPFSFTRHTGENIIPGDMLTDGGSIPQLFQGIPGFSPWEYGPAFIIHDWEFQQHDQGAPKSFEEANLTLAEGIWTLMTQGIARKDKVVLTAIWAAVSSPVGRHIWDS